MKHWDFQRLVTYRETGWVEGETAEEARKNLSDPSFTLSIDGMVDEAEVADDINDVEIESLAEMESDE